MGMFSRGTLPPTEHPHPWPPKRRSFTPLATPRVSREERCLLFPAKMSGNGLRRTATLLRQLRSNNATAIRGAPAFQMTSVQSVGEMGRSAANE